MEIVGFYPMWYVPTFGSAAVIAIIASIHVLASHTSVGASILLAYLATKAYRENIPQIYDYIKKYLLALLVFSYVSGSITGPGIWFSATVANPRGISALIHNFVWVWAAEWIWFVAEVTLVYILFYTLGRVDQRTWLKLAWIFAIGSWATMYIIARNFVLYAITWTRKVVYKRKYLRCILQQELLPASTYEKRLYVCHSWHYWNSNSKAY